MMSLTDTSYAHLNAGWSWFGVQDLLSNAFYSWRLHPFLTLLAQGSVSLYVLLLCVITVGSSWWSLTQSGRKGSHAIGAGAILVISYGLLFEVNIPVLSFISAVSASTAALLYLHRQSEPLLRRVIATMVAGIFISLLSGQLGFIVLLFAYPMCAALTKEPLIANRFSLVFSILIALPVFTAPNVQFPDYPSDGMLIPGYGTAYGIDPLISSAPRRPVIDREYTQSAFIVVSLLLLVIAGIAYRKDDRKLALIIAVSAVVMLLDSSLCSATIRTVSPIQTLSRIVPGHSFFPVTVFIAAGALIAVSYVGRIALLLGILVFHPHTLNPIFGDLWHPVLPKDRYHESPSLYLLRTEGSDHTLSLDGSWEPLSLFDPTLSASHNQTALRAILNDKPRDRWSTKAVSQTGTEWIEIALRSPVQISGIDLSLTRFSSDFPRGIRIRTGTKDGDTCTFTQVIFEKPRWIGSILRTPAGYPYYSPESTIRIPFSPITTRCIRIEQIGRSDSFEWSIEGIKILIPS